MFRVCCALAVLFGGAEVERLVWARPVEPEAVRKVFEENWALRPVFEGRFFVLDAIQAPAPRSPVATSPASAALVCGI